MMKDECGMMNEVSRECGRFPSFVIPHSSFIISLLGLIAPGGAKIDHPWLLRRRLAISH
jgi:hypothetical protein